MKATIVEDDFTGDISHKGHGVQRAVIVALVHALNVQRNVKLRREAEDGNMEAVVPDLLLVIEEPELYQHPTRARHFSQALSNLVSDTAEGPRVQVVISTHSPYFVSLAQFDSVRMLRRKHVVGQPVPERTVGRTTLELVATELANAYEPPRTNFTAAGLRAKLHGILDNALREGFFADSIALVEGDSDQALLAGLCAIKRFDYEAAGLAILPVNGKNNLDKALLIFRQLGIPTYVVFDGDGHKDARARSANRPLLKMLRAEATESPQSGVYENYSVFRDNLERQMNADFGEALTRVFPEVADEYGYTDMHSARKVPLVVAETLRRLYASGNQPHYFEDLFARLRALAEQHRQAIVA